MRNFWSICSELLFAIKRGDVFEAQKLVAEASVVIGETSTSINYDRNHAILQRYKLLVKLRENKISQEEKVVPKTARLHKPSAKLSLVTSVFNRFWQLRQTLPKNLEAARKFEDIEIVIVDFVGSDSGEIAAMIEKEFSFELLNGTLKYFRAQEPWAKFHMATAKNVAHRLSSGQYIFSVDADNFVTAEDLGLILDHFESRPNEILHQTTGSAPLRHKQWSRYKLFDSVEDYHDQNLTWDGSCGRIGISREAFESVNGYNENFVGMGMDDIDFIVRSIRSGAGYRHISISRPSSGVFIDNGSASDAHQHEDNQQNWQRMDEALEKGQLVPLYQTDSPIDRFRELVPTLVRRSAESRVTLFSSLFGVEPYIDRFLHDLRQIKRTHGVCVWLFDVVASHPSRVSYALKSEADNKTVFYVPVQVDPGLYSLWNIAIEAIGSPFLGNLNADDLRGEAWLSRCLVPLESGLADIASPITVPFEDERAIDYGTVLANLRAEGKRESRWFESRVVLTGDFPDEKPKHEPLIDGEYTHQDFFQVLPTGELASYCIPNASAVWSRRVHELAGYFDEQRYGSFTDLALWAEAGSRGLRFRQVPYPALFFISESQAHRRQMRSEDQLMQLALRYGAPKIKDWVSRRQFDLSRIGGSYGDHHFMGWNWVRDEVGRNFQHTNSKLLLDMFVERNFFWNPNPEEKNYEYRVPWLGFVHTTPHTNAAFDQKGQNLDVLLAEPRFQRSLRYCRGLVVLSEQNQRYLSDSLKKTHASIPIYRLFHPNIPMAVPDTACTVDLGTVSAPKIFHVGWHLRSFSAFARLKVDRRRKVLLIPKSQPKENFLREVVDKELRLEGLGTAEQYFGDVYTASQADYAHILMTGIVFNHYLEPAGSNLISECISAGTRLVINRHPAFEEYLGRDYPLFYDSNEEANIKVAMAESPRTVQMLREHMREIERQWSVDLFCRELSRVGEDVYSRI